MEGNKTEQDIFLKALRSGTAEAHNLLEQNRISQAITGSTVNRDDYIAYLKAFYGFVKPLEEIIYPMAGEIIPDSDQRRRSHLLHHDLLYFKLDKTEIESLPAYDFSGASNTDIFSALGAMYVMEGSTLGGQVICRQLNKTLGLQAPDGMSFFYGHGTQTGPMWKEFLSNFTTAAVQGGQQEAIIASAKDTFARFEHWLARI
jgi:heme oxygenase